MDMTIGEQVALWRRRRLLEQKELADKAKLSRNTVVDVENGNGNPNLATLRAIAEALDLQLVVELRPQETNQSC